MEMDTGILNLRQQFQKHGFKYTVQREAVLNTLLEHKNLHMSSEDIYTVLRAKYPDIGQATVYRALLLLEKMHLIRKTDLQDGCTRYELCDNKGHAHHHLICSRCGAVIDMEDDLLEELENQIYVKKHFTVENHSVKFFGCCEKCRE